MTASNATNRTHNEHRTIHWTFECTSSKYDTVRCHIEKPRQQAHNMEDIIANKRLCLRMLKDLSLAELDNRHDNPAGIKS